VGVGKRACDLGDFFSHLILSAAIIDVALQNY